MYLKSRVILGTAVALMLSEAVPAQAQDKRSPGKEMTTVNMGHIPSMVYGGIYVAIDKGYFAEQGLNINLVIVRGADTTYQIAGGTLNLAGGSPDSAFFNAIQRGLPVGIVGSIAVAAGKTSYPLVVRKDLVELGAVKSVADLKGRRVGNLAPGGITEYLVNRALQSGGLQITDVNMVTPMGFPQLTDSLSTKALDAALLGEPFAALAVQRQHGVKLTNESYDAGEQILTIKFNKERVNEDMLVNFLVAFLKGQRDLNGDGFRNPENLRILEKYTKTPIDVLRATVPPEFPPDGAMNVESIMRQQNYFLARGYLERKEPLATNAFIDTTYLKRALERLGR